MAKMKKIKFRLPEPDLVAKTEIRFSGLCLPSFIIHNLGKSDFTEPEFKRN